MNIEVLNKQKNYIKVGKKAKSVSALLIASCVMLGHVPAQSQSFDAQDVSIQDFTGNVVIKNRTASSTDQTIRVEIKQGKTLYPVNVALDGETLVVEGEKWRDDSSRNCCDTRIRRTENRRKDRRLSTGEPLGDEFFEKHPTLTITLPLKTDVTFIDARMTLAMDDLDGKLDLHGCYVWGNTGDVDEAVVGLVHGSRLIMGDIDSGIEIDISGDADLKVGTVAIADVDIAGPGDVVFDRVDGILDISIAGSGVVRSDWVEGPMTMRVAGSGGAAIKDGRADKLKLIVDGSGGLLFDGLVISPDLRLYGSSEVRLAKVQGRVVHEGSGQLYVGGKLREK